MIVLSAANPTRAAHRSSSWQQTPLKSKCLRNQDGYLGAYQSQIVTATKSPHRALRKPLRVQAIGAPDALAAASFCAKSAATCVTIPVGMFIGAQTTYVMLANILDMNIADSAKLSDPRNHAIIGPLVGATMAGGVLLGAAIWTHPIWNL